MTEIEQLKRELNEANKRNEHHRRLGITLLNAKWLDPECHQGCKSLVLKNKLAAAQKEIAELKERISNANL